MKDHLKKTRQSRLLAAAALVPLLALTGCATHSQDHFTVGSTSQNNYKTNHPIVLDEKEQTLDIPVASESYGLPRATLSAIEGYGSRFKSNASGVITIMLPSRSANQKAARHIMPQIVDTLAAQGISRDRMRTTTYDASRHGSSAPIRLSHMAVEASVARCGRWGEDLADTNTENRNYGNFGCATQNNLAAQLANPADLLSPRGVTPIDATRRSNAIEDYRRDGG